MNRVALLLCSALAALAASLPVGASQRPLQPQDLATLLHVDEPQVSPDGDWVAYTVERTDEAQDESVTSLWMVSWDGTKPVQLTHGSVSAGTPRWSPDGRYLAFLRTASDEEEDDAGKQVWLLDRRGGEAQQLTHLRGELSDFAWSPDGKRLALVLKEEGPEERERKAQGTESDEDERPRPIVIDRYQFKSDEDGYRHGKEQPLVFLYEIASGALTALTGEKAFAEHSPAWSPDGDRIALVSNRDEDWDRTENEDVWVMDARPGTTLQRLTRFAGADDAPLSWSPDGRSIAYLQGSEPRYWLYDYYQLGLLPAGGGEPRLPTARLDRDISDPRFTADGRFVDFLVTDDRRRYLARIPVGGGEIRALTSGDLVVRAHSRSAERPGRIAVLASTAASPPAIYALEKGGLRQLTRHNDAWLAGLRLGTTADIAFRGHDGVEVRGLLTKPPSWEAGRKFPTILWIHGGPYGQDEYAFDFEQQLFAAQGYLVLQVNYRGSSGRGVDFGRGIYADWGNADLKDLLAGVDYLIAAGLADPERLGVGGWSQGGILTDFVIAHDQRFKAAISGAGVANQLGMYGHDQYVYMYDLEFGQPWVNTDLWIRLSYPFFNAGRIRTPTLFMCGDRDFNVPVHGSEQMYQALKSMKVPTQLVIYPGEHHSISRPSFARDRYERYLAWYAQYLH